MAAPVNRPCVQASRISAYALLPQLVQQLDDRPRGGDLVVQHDHVLARDVADDPVDHHRVVGQPLLGARGDREVEDPGQLAGHLGVAEVRGDDHACCCRSSTDEVLGQRRDRVQVVDGDGEEAVHLRRVQVHGEHPVRPGGRRACRPPAAPPMEIRGASFLSDRAYAKCGITAVMWCRRGAPRGVQHQEQLEQVVLHRRDQGLHDVHVTASAVGPQLDLQAVVAEPGGPRGRQRDAEDLAHLVRERRMSGA